MSGDFIQTPCKNFHSENELDCPKGLFCAKSSKTLLDSLVFKVKKNDLDRCHCGVFFTNSEHLALAWKRGRKFTFKVSNNNTRTIPIPLSRIFFNFILFYFWSTCRNTYHNMAKTLCKHKNLVQTSHNSYFF